MGGFVFITDTHIMSSSKVRTGDVVQDIKNKLRFVVDYCNTNDCVLLIGGDLFDKATVPDFVKSEIAPVLMSMKNDIWSVSGNHDRLYDNPEYNYKTSYNVWCSHGIIHDLDSVGGVTIDNVYVTSTIPVLERGMNQIVVFHGFLNQEDGRNTFRFTDIDPAVVSDTFICLGHDHVPYENLQYKSNIRIIRPGSLLRGNRVDTNKRVPELVHIKVSNNRLVSKFVSIRCRDWEEVFTTKLTKISKAQQHNTYEEIISQIKNAQAGDLTLEQALRQIATPDVVDFALNLLQQFNLDKQFNKV